MFQGGKFLRGRKYSFPFNQKEKRKSSENTKINNYNQLKKLNNKNSKNLMMLNISGDLLSQGYEDKAGFSGPSKRMNISKPSMNNSRQHAIKYSTNGKKKKSNSAHSSPHRNGLKSTKNQNYSSNLMMGLGPGSMNEVRPYSAKNSAYNRSKGYSSKSK